MNKITLLTLSILSCISGYPQVITVTFDDGQHLEWFEIDTINDPGNIWQIGKPAKSVFTSAHSAPNALVTDTLLPFPPNDTSEFIIQYPPDDYGYPWYDAELGFYYRMDSDEGDDFGFIEVSFNEGSTWLNFNSPPLSDCYNGDAPYFTGDTGWDYFWIDISTMCLGIYEQDTIWYRFTFISGPETNEKDGWMIDDMLLVDWYEDVPEYKVNNQFIKIYPNPAQDLITIKCERYKPDSKIIIHDVYGRIIDEIILKGNTTPITMNVETWPPGMYLVAAFSNGIPAGRARFVVE